jgi:hypothetical protein
MGSDNVTAVWGAESGHIGVAVQDAVAVVTLRRPDKLNALTADACRELAAIVHRWTPPGGATAAHLTLLRPPMAEIELAMAAETEATRATEADGLPRQGINRFLGRPRPAELDEAL